MVKARFGSLLGLWAVYFAITIALALAFGIGMAGVGIAGFAAMGSESLTDGSALGMGAGMIVVLVLFYLAYILAAMAQYASMIVAASPLRQTGFGDALGAGWRAAPAMLLLMVILAIGYLVAGAALGVLGAALGEIGSTVALLLMLAAVIWVACRLAPLLAVMAVDGVRNPFTAIGRAWNLTRGHALTIFLASLVVVVIIVIICGLALLPSFSMIATMADPSSIADVGSAVGGFALLTVGITVAWALYVIIYSAFQAVIHGLLANASGDGVVEAFA
jgi:hypothetical protein